MAKIIWSENFSVKIEEIDRQHRKLIDLINQLDDAMSQGKGKDVLGKILTSLIGYTQTHFTYEERLMTQHAYPNLAEHQAEHQRLIQKVADLDSQFKSGRIGLTIPTMSFLNNWLTKHINDTDKQYSAHLNGKGVR